MNKYFILLVVYFKLIASSFAISNIDARTWILVDYHSDEIIHEFDPDTKINPASMTKIMTSIIAFDLLKNNKLSLDDTLQFLKKPGDYLKAGIPQCLL